MPFSAKYTNFMAFAVYDELYYYIIGMILFIANLKFLRLLRFNKHVSHFFTTLKLCRRELAYFSVSFFTLFLAYCCFANLVFGLTMYDFHTFFTTMETLYSMLIGRFVYKEMEKVDR